MSTPSEFVNDVRARLDADIAAAEQRVAELHLKRKGLDALEDYMRTAAPSLARPAAAHRPVVVTPPPSEFTGPTELVFSVLKRGQVYTVDSARKALAETGAELTREQVRNALHYLVRKDSITRRGRGAWSLHDEDPAGTGSSFGSPTMQEGGGGSHETDEKASAPAADQHHPQLGASITEVAV